MGCPSAAPHQVAQYPSDPLLLEHVPGHAWQMLGIGTGRNIPIHGATAVAVWLAVGVYGGECASSSVMRARDALITAASAQDTHVW
jgi:hypothetical protein